LTLPIVTSIVDMNTVFMMNSAIACLPNCTQKIPKHWGCQEQPNGNGGLHAHNVTPIIDINSASGWVQQAMKSNTPTLFCIIYCGQHTDSTSGSQMPRRGGCSYVPLDNILPPLAKEMIDDIREE